MRRPGAPLVTGLSPKEGIPGTQITIRGENLGTDPNDLVALFICGTDCLVSAKWKSPSKIVARLGQAKRGPGDVIIVTASGGRGTSEMKFRVFIEEISPLQESSVWVDESHTVPGRTVARNLPESIETDDMLGLKVESKKKPIDPAELQRLFPEGSGNRRMESFSPAWYLLEHHRGTSLADLERGIRNIRLDAEKERKSTKDVHKANLSSLISCVDALSLLHDAIEAEKKAGRWPLTTTLSKKIEDSKKTSDNLFKDVLSRKDTADTTRNALSVLTRFRFIFMLPETIDENMAKGEYSTILNDYARAKSLLKDTEVPLFKDVLSVLETKMAQFKRRIRDKLIDVPTTFEEQSKLIKYLKVLDPASDPAWDCITAYHKWLEDVFWQLQDKHYHAVVEEEKQRVEGLFPVENVYGHRQQFVTELLGILTDKLQSFWKLAQAYSNASDEQYKQRQEDVNQMLQNTANVGSWLIFNALMPSALPTEIRNQYAGQFVDWPPISHQCEVRHLLMTLTTLRMSIKTLIEFQFTYEHIKTLIELCTIIRMKVIGSLTHLTGDTIVALAERENWKVDVVGNQSKTSLPDMYESEINDTLPNFKAAFSHNGYPHEVDLFSREVYKETIVSYVTAMILDIKRCYDRLLTAGAKGPRSLLVQQQPQLDDSASLSSANDVDNRGPTSSPAAAARPTSIEPGLKKPSARKYLISVCNMDYIINHSLPLICDRLGQNGVKHTSDILENVKAKLSIVRDSFSTTYLAFKESAIADLVKTVDYDILPVEDASHYVKELIMLIVFVQAELYQLAPQLMKPMVTKIVDNTLNRLISTLRENVEGATAGSRRATQIVIDVTALEDSLKCFLSHAVRKSFSSIRARLMGRLDQERFQNSMHHFHLTTILPNRSLDIGGGDSDVGESDDSISGNIGGGGMVDDDDLDTSHV